MVEDFGRDSRLSVRKDVAGAFTTQALAFLAQGDLDRAVDALRREEQRFRDDEHPDLQARVAATMLLRAAIGTAQGAEARQGAMSTYRNLIERFEGVADDRIRTVVTKAREALMGLDADA